MIVARHGRLDRTPLTSRDQPVAAVAKPLRAAEQARPGEREASGRDELERLTTGLLERPCARTRWMHRASLACVLDWLEGFPGESWQQRWLLSGSDAAGWAWVPQELTGPQRLRFTKGTGILIVLRAVRPAYSWLFASRLLGVYDRYRLHNQAATFARLTEQASHRGGSPEHETEALNALTRMVIVTGKDLLALDVDDVLAYAAARRATGRITASLSFAYDLLKDAGGLAGAPPTLRHAEARGQLSPGELIDYYPIASREIRDLLVYYLTERAAVLDYASLTNLAYMLAGLFWADLERHHPGITSLQLPPAVACDWKTRIRTLPGGRPRRNFHAVLLAVRSFYLDLLQWSLEDPARWARWAAPCPISESDIRGYIKEVRRTQARMQARTRTLAPALPRLAETAAEYLAWATRVLQAGRGTPPGGEFEAGGTRYRRLARSQRAEHRIRLLAVSGPGEVRIDAGREEENAFWTWAVVEVLRRTGVRVEELTEITHLSLRQYQAPTGEQIPLLQISPSKTDTERVIPADPELVAVLARIIRRVRDGNDHIPLVSRYDQYERVFSVPLPHLFQRVCWQRRQVLSTQLVNELLRRLAVRAEIRDADGSLLTFTAHDFRRIFATETVNSGLPIHIAAKLLGHLDLNTTQGYVAVYPSEVIRHYQNFVEQRRWHRPAEEYREPSDAEWEEFRDHFALRQVALGTCGRPYGTPCQHESACIRCPMLRMDLAQVPRLLAIEDNTRERLAEARQMQWLGEVSALEESLRHIAGKKQQADRLRAQAGAAGNGPGALG